MKQFKVEENEAGKRIDAYISIKDENISRTSAQRLIEEGNILVNGNKPKASYKVVKDDLITIEEEQPKEIELKAQEIPLEIIYEDEDIIVVNKPKGLVVHPAAGNPDGTLVNAIMAICKETLSGIGGEIRPGIVHRLDKDTSGLLIVAKNDTAHINLSEQIKNHEITKTYVALVRGVIKEDHATINMPTGRTHQIRVHLSQIGFPVIGDYTYSNGKNEFGVEGQMLHAKRLEFKHPRTGKQMDLTAQEPEYFKKIIEELDNK